MRVERVVLEHHCDVTVLGLNIGHVTVTNENAARVDIFKAGQHTQRSGLATARRTDQNQEFAIRDLQV